MKPPGREASDEERHAYPLLPGVYKNDWPADYRPFVGIEYDVFVKAFSSFSESVFRVGEAVQRAKGMIDSILYPWASGAFRPLIDHPIRDKSKGGWIAWCDGKWRKCERRERGWAWSE